MRVNEFDLFDIYSFQQNLLSVGAVVILSSRLSLPRWLKMYKGAYIHVFWYIF